MTSRVTVAKASAALAADRKQNVATAPSNFEHLPVPLFQWSCGALQIQPKLAIGAPDDPLEREADAAAAQVMRMPDDKVQRKCSGCKEEDDEKPQTVARKAVGPGPHTSQAPALVGDVLQQSGAPLDSATRAFFEPRFGFDFSRVRLHTSSQAQQSARSIQASAYTAGHQVVFGAGQFAPSTSDGRQLLAHELAHVVQQNGATVRRTIELRDVGPGEQSGFAKRGELIVRLNRVANGLVFLLDDHNVLKYTENPYGTITNFERQMMGFIDSGTVLPLRLTNSQGLLGSRRGGFNTPVSADDFNSGYVDVDDLLASDDLNLQTVLVHLLAERNATPNYARRMGNLADPDTGVTINQPEFDRSHQVGLDAERQVLRDFFSDPTIQFVNEPTSGPFTRVWRNSRRDLIRERHTARQGVDAFSTSVQLHDNRTMTGEEYRDFLAAQAAAAAAAAPAAPGPAAPAPAAPAPARP